jgi:hypothetical protein
LASGDNLPSRSRSIWGAPGEKAIPVRVIGRPHDLVRADIVGEYGDAIFDRLEGDPTIPLEEFARLHLWGSIIASLVVEMAVHAIEPRRDPPAARFEKRDAQSRMTIDHTTPDHAQRRQHHLHRMADHVARRMVCLKAVDADGRHRAAGALVKADRKLELFGHRP